MIDLPKLPCPPGLDRIIGYAGEAHYLALWTPNGDAIVYADGWMNASGDWRSWQLFANHREVQPYLQGALCPQCQGTGCDQCHRKGFVVANFGDRLREPDHWLLLDRREGRWSMGKVREVKRFLMEQHTAPMQQEWSAAASVLVEAFLGGASTLLEQDICSVLRQEPRHAEVVRWLEEAG